MKKIAILDTGVGAKVDDFTKLNVKKSLDFTTSEFSELNPGLDDNGHGTTCAKIILKNANKSEIYSLKVLDKNRCGMISDLYKILYGFLNYPHKHYIYKQFHNCKSIHFTTNLPRLNEP